MGQFTPQVESEFGFTETAPLIKGILALWFVLLIPWLPFAVVIGMGFEGGLPWTWEAYVLIWSIWTYPVSVYVAFIFRQKMPVLALLPLLNLAGICVSLFSH